MRAREVTLGSNTRVDVKLESGVMMDDVVVTALGVSKEKTALGYAVSEFSGDDLGKSGEQNVIQQLAAKAPGVQVIGSGGTPGASSKVLIRGPSTFTGENQPLIVIDGVPVDNSTSQSSPRDYPFNANLQGVNNSNRAIDNNPNDIESVTILKEPAAAALYGARAGNGAIIYTTKRGKTGKKGPGVKVSSSVELSKVNKLPDFQDKYGPGINGNSIALADPGPDERFDNSPFFVSNDDVAFGTPNSWGRSNAENGDVTFDNIDNFYETGVAFVNNIEISGGKENSLLRLAIGDNRRSGVVPNTDFNRTSMRLTADFKPSELIKIGGTANYIKSTGTMAQNGSNLSGESLSLFRMPNTFDVRNYKSPLGFNNTYFFAYDNPLYSVFENPFTTSVDRFLGNMYVDLDLAENLKVTYRIGIDQYADSRKQIFAVTSNNDDLGQVGQINENRLKGSQMYADLIMTYTKSLTDKLNLNASLGHNFFITQFDDLFARGRIMSIPNFYNLSNTSDLYSSNYSETLKTFAFFGNLELDYDRWFYIALTGRNEWSSSFQLDNNNFFYPSASASVVFTELWDSKPTWLSFGKVRYSFAAVGIAPEPYNTATYFVTPTYPDGFTNGLTFPYGSVNGFGISNTLGNPNLKPERLIGNEVGVFVSILDDLFSLDVTYYNQKSKDILLFVPVAQNSGFSSQYTNGAEMVNQGWEVQLGINPYRNRDFTWSVDINWSTNNNEVTKLADCVEEVNLEAAFASIASFARVGEPIGEFYGTKWRRDSNRNIIIGANGRPQIDSKTGKIGSWIPDWIGGIRNTFSYKDLTLSVLLDFRKGGDVWNGTYARLNNVGRSGDSEAREQTYIVEGVTETGEANTVAISAQDYFRFVVGDAGGAAEEFIETVDLVRLRDLSLSYRLKFRSDAQKSHLDFTFTAINLWLSTNYKGVDPETSLTGAGSNLNGFDYFNNPGIKSFMLGVAFTF